MAPGRPGPDRLGSARHGRIPRGPAGAATQPSSTIGTCMPPPSSQGIIALRGPRRPAWPGPGQTRVGRPVLSPWTEGRLPFRPGRSLALFLRPTLPARRPGRWGHWPPAELVRVRSRWAMPRCAGWPGIQPAWVRALSLGRRPGALPHSLFTSAFCRSAGGRGHCGSHFSPASYFLECFLVFLRTFVPINITQHSVMQLHCSTRMFQCCTTLQAAATSPLSLALSEFICPVSNVLGSVPLIPCFVAGNKHILFDMVLAVVRGRVPS